MLGWQVHEISGNLCLYGRSPEAPFFKENIAYIGGTATACTVGALAVKRPFYKEDKAIVEFMRQIKFLLILYLLGLMDFKSRRVIMHGLEVQTAHKIL